MPEAPLPTIKTPFWRPALAAAAATGSGVGLARFAYVPLFPAMVGAGWVDGGGAGLLGAANLAGYLVGVLGGRRVARRIGVPAALDIGMGLAVLAFAACAWNGGLAWFAGWRGLAGVAGGVLMGLAGPAMQAVVEPRRRGLAGGIAIGGVGGGVATASILVPLLVGPGGMDGGGGERLSLAWLGLAAVVALLWAFAHPRWPGAPVVAAAAGPSPPGAWQVVIAYALAAGGMVPPMVYLADLAVRGRGLSLELGSAIWLLFGLGGVLGTLSAGRAVDRWGGRPALRVWFGLQVVALALCLPPVAGLLWPAALLGGFAAMGQTAVVLAVVRELAAEGAGALWGRTTAGFAVTQACVAFPLAQLFAATGESHFAVFATGLALSVAALGVALRR